MVFTMGMATKEIRKLIRALEAQGWRVEETGSGHYQAYSPNGEDIVTIPGTPSDHRSMRNTMSRLKRAGFKP